MTLPVCVWLMIYSLMSQNFKSKLHGCNQRSGDIGYDIVTYCMIYDLRLRVYDLFLRLLIVVLALKDSALLVFCPDQAQIFFGIWFNERPDQSVIMWSAAGSMAPRRFRADERLSELVGSWCGRKRCRRSRSATALQMATAILPIYVPVMTLVNFLNV